MTYKSLRVVDGKTKKAPCNGGEELDVATCLRCPYADRESLASAVHMKGYDRFSGTFSLSRVDNDQVGCSYVEGCTPPDSATNSGIDDFVSRTTSPVAMAERLYCVARVMQPVQQPAARRHLLIR